MGTQKENFKINNQVSNSWLEKEINEIKKTNILNCLINSQGNVLLGGEPIAIKDVNREVRRRLTKNDKLIISVKAHEKTKYGDYVAVIDQLKRANATRISIADSES